MEIVILLSKESEDKYLRLVTSCGVLFGGNANNGSKCGFVYSNSNNVPSNANANIASHLYFYVCNKIKRELQPHLLVKNIGTRKRVGRCCILIRQQSKARSMEAKKIIKYYIYEKIWLSV